METGLLLIQEQKFNEAEQYFQDLLTKDKHNYQAHNYLGMTYAFLGQIDRAIECLQEAVSLEPNYAEALTNLGVLLAMQDKKNEAIGVYRQALGINNQIPELHNNLGLLLRDTDKWQEAIDEFEQAIALAPNYVDAIVNLGLVYAGQSKRREAIKNLERAIDLQPDKIDAYLHLGNLLREEKQLFEAQTALQKAIKLSSGHSSGLSRGRADLHNQLGMVFRDQKELTKAEAQYRQAIFLDDQYAEAYRNLGVVLYRQGKAQADKTLIDEAVENFEKAIELDPKMPEAHNNLGIAYRDRGEWAKAKVSFQKAIELRPRYAIARKNLGEILCKEDDTDGAITQYAEAINAKPDDADCYLILCNLLIGESKLGEAMEVCKKGLEINSESAVLHQLDGILNIKAYRYDEAITALQKSKELDPKQVDTLSLLASALLATGRTASARAEFEQAIPKSPSFHISIKLALSLPVITTSVQEIEDERRRLVNDLQQLTSRGATFQDPIKDLGNANFYIAYHGKNDRSIMTEIGQFLVKACPVLDWTAPHCRATAPVIHAKIRLGICSQLLKTHTIGKLYGSILKHLDRNKFEIILIRIGEASPDPMAQEIANSADRVVNLNADFFKGRQQIADLELDILFYPDIGMTAQSYFLCFARLAPVQCLTWGHPSTTGAPHIDYFISSTLFETEQAQDHYSEKLIKFRNPNTYYSRPIVPPPIDRVSLGLPETGTLYLCPQSLFKIHPEFDPMLGAILQGDPKGKIIFIRGQSQHWSELLQTRWQKHIPDVWERIHFINGLSYEQFLQLLTLGDVMLDPIHFGGGNTSLEGFAMGIPIVTLPSEYLKCRLTYGFYRQMDMMDCVANGPQEYVQIALRLGTDPAYNQQIRAKIAQKCPILYSNPHIIEEYTRFFVTAHALYRADRSK